MKYLETDKHFYSRVALISLPIAAQSLITVGVSLMGTLMLGSLGETPLSAASLANQFITLYQICCMGIGMGANVLTARFWGMKDHESLKKAITIMLRFCLVFGAIFTIAAQFFPEAIMRAYTTDPILIEQGVRYFRWAVPTFYLLGFSLTCTIVLRSVGIVTFPLISSIIAFFLNIGVSYIFIFGKLGMPRMEIEGAALGTLISRSFEFCFICGFFFFKDQRIGYRIKDVFMKSRDLVKDYFLISIPVLISDTLLAFGNTAVAMVMGRISSEFVSANAITMVTQQLTTVLIQGICNASVIMTGNTLGEGDREKAQRQGYTFLFLGAAFGILSGIIVWAISKPVVNCYNIQIETKVIAEQLMSAIGFIIIFQSMNSILTKGVLRGGGDTKFLMVADILFLWIASIPLGALAGLVWHLPAFWIYTLLKIDQIIKAVWCVFRLRGGKWIKKI